MSTPVTSAPTGGVQITKTPIAGAQTKVPYRVWYNGTCKVFEVPGQLSKITTNGRAPVEAVVPDEAAVDRALGPIDPKLHRPPTPAEAADCMGPVGPPPGPPPNWTGGPLRPPRGPNLPCKDALPEFKCP